MKRSGLLCNSLLLSVAALLIGGGLWREGFAGTVQLPQTGQASCYGTFGRLIDCAESGHDGDKKAGVPWPIPRFTDHHDGTMTDNLTGLMWTKDAGVPQIGQCKAGARIWEEAFRYTKCVNSTGYCGYSDWRLPNINELRSLAHIGYNEPTGSLYLSDWLISQGFINVRLNSYWSSTSYAGGTDCSGADCAWLVYMWNGYTNYNYKDINYSVWLVRDSRWPGVAPVFKTGQTASYATRDDGYLQEGVAWPHPRFTDNGNGTVTDNLTGLIWLQNANCTDPVAGVVKTLGFLSWADALTWTNSLAAGACNLSDGSVAGDWRLPNREELESLIHFGYFNIPLADTAGTGQGSEGDPFSNVRPGFYWSSSTDFNAPYLQNGVMWQHGAWIVNMWNASVGSCKKAYNGYAWPVRGGEARYRPSR